MTGRGASLVTRTRQGMLVVATVSVVVVFVLFYAAWLRYTVDYRTAELGRQVAALATGLSAGGPLTGTQDTAAGSATELRTRLFRVQAGLIGARLVITDAEGAVQVSSDEGAAERYDLSVLDEPDDRGVRTAVASLGAGRAVIVAAPIEGGTSGYLVALQPVREINNAQQRVLLLLGAAALIAMAVAWFAGGLMARRVSSRVVRLGSAAEDIAAGEWGRQVEVDGDDEVASLARSFNRMSSRVAEAYRAQKDFVGDVSHELRTPITTIGGFAGALLDGTVTDTDTRERFLTGIRDESQRLAELTQTLLSLSDMDAGRVTVAREPLDLSGLRDALSGRFSAVAVERGIEFRVRLEDGAGCVPLGDQARVLQVASALVSNAMMHVPHDGVVEVACACSGDRWLLIVDDNGPGVPVAQRERIFERFVRLDVSRSAETGGSGLGLSICARLVELMGGTIVVEDAPLGGARFCVSVPARS